jgi:LysR family transcriptional regulator, regulator of the ytmI operon
MELRHLLTFQAVVKAGSFLQAAEELQYAQSTITLHIQQLEAELGVKIFERRGKQVHLSIAGRALYEQVEQLLQRATALQQTMTDIVAGEAGHVRFGAIEPIASVHLPAVVIEYYQTHPKVQLTFETGGTQYVARRVAQGLFDFGICSPPAASLGLTFEPLFREKMLLLMPEGHPLASREIVTLSDLAGQRILLTEKACAYRDLTESAFAAAGTNPFSGIEIGNIMAIRRVIQGGVGIALLPQSCICPTPPGTVTREISGMDVALPVGFVYLPDVHFSGRILEPLMGLIRAKLPRV